MQTQKRLGILGSVVLLCSTLLVAPAAVAEAGEETVTLEALLTQSECDSVGDQGVGSEAPEFLPTILDEQLNPEASNMMCGYCSRHTDCRCYAEMYCPSGKAACHFADGGLCDCLY